MSKTSYFDVTLPVTVSINDSDQQDHQRFTLLLLASCCYPVLYLDKTDTGDETNRILHFTPCFVGNTYFKDIQLWNRSECTLEYSINTMQMIPQISLSEYDSGSKIDFGQSLKLAPFASKRVRVSFRSSTVGEGTTHLRVQNLNNPENVFGVACNYSVVDKDETDVISIVLDDGTVLPYGKVFTVDTVYSDIVRIEGFWIQNNSKGDIELSVSNRECVDVHVNFSKLFLEKKHNPEFISDEMTSHGVQDLDPADDSASSADGSQSDLDLDTSLVSNMEPVLISRKESGSMRSDFDTWGTGRFNFESILPYSYLRLDFKEAKDLSLEDNRYFLGNSKSKSRSLSSLHYGSNVIVVGAGKRIPCTVQIKTKADSGVLQKNIYNIDLGLVSPALGKSYIRVIKCRASCCRALISVPSPVLNLGECCVGEYRQFFINVTNECDLPVVASPFVESDTIGVITKEVSIPPHETRQVKLEFVPKIVSLDYHRVVFIKNSYNPSNNLEVEVKARNLDTHQVLLHSQFYKINVRNTMRQVQIFYDVCLYGKFSFLIHFFVFHC